MRVLFCVCLWRGISSRHTQTLKGIFFILSSLSLLTGGSSLSTSDTSLWFKKRIDSLQVICYVTQCEVNSSLQFTITYNLQ